VTTRRDENGDIIIDRGRGRTDRESKEPKPIPDHIPPEARPLYLKFMKLGDRYHDLTTLAYTPLTDRIQKERRYLGNRAFLQLENQATRRFNNNQPARTSVPPDGWRDCRHSEYFKILSRLCGKAARCANAISQCRSDALRTCGQQMREIGAFTDRSWQEHQTQVTQYAQKRDDWQAKARDMRAISDRFHARESGGRITQAQAGRRTADHYQAAAVRERQDPVLSQAEQVERMRIAEGRPTRGFWSSIFS